MLRAISVRSQPIRNDAFIDQFINIVNLSVSYMLGKLKFDTHNITII
jgi:hypothetical protein